VRKIENWPISGQEEYSILALHLGTTTGSKYWLYYVSASVVVWCVPVLCCAVLCCGVLCSPPIVHAALQQACCHLLSIYQDYPVMLCGHRGMDTHVHASLQ
jgi:hypothetical protein